MMKKLLTAAGLFILFLTSPLMAQADSPLTGAKIEKFLGTWAPLQELGNKYSLDLEHSPQQELSADDEFNPFETSLAAIRGHKAYGEFMGIIKDAGFSSAEEWADTANRIMQSYFAVTMGSEEFAQSRAEIDKAISEVKSNPHISESQKEAIISNLNTSMAMMNSMKNVPEADMNAVKPYMGKIEQTLSEDTK